MRRQVVVLLSLALVTAAWAGETERYVCEARVRTAGPEARLRGARE